MEISVGFPSSLHAPAHIVLAEELGYRRAWCYDAPAIFADIWMTLARAADRTSRIGLGTAVIIPDYRHLMTTASAVATLAGQAPGRVTVGLGPGRAQIMHGGKPGLWKDLEAYTVALRGLLRGQTVEWNGTPHRLLHPVGAVASTPIDVPILLSAEGPKGLEIASRVADGVISFGQPREGFAWNAVLLHGTVLPDGPVDADYLLAAAGAGAGAAYHITYAGAGDAVDKLPNGAVYRAAVEALPADERANAIWTEHLVSASAQERLALTPESIRSTTFTGSADELRERLAEMEKGGATEVMYQPSGPNIQRELEAFAQMAGIA
ncbi:MAG: LLM class flavin-dependent oxidoreductase [Sporichthyaceae bacterium]|jgi:5,10-methylenetetrahydromethanopterin reductase